MTSVWLSERLPDESARRALCDRVSHLLSGLDVEFTVKNGDSPRIEVSGRDEEAAANHLRNEMDPVPEELEEGLEFKGRLVEPGSVGFGVFVDLGREEALLPLHALRELEESSVKGASDRFGLVDGLPVEVRVVEVGDGPEVELTEEELSRLKRRREEGALLVLGATRSAVKRALRETGFSGDVKSVEKLGVSEQAVICGGGVDPVGLIPRIGPLLPAAELHPVSK